METREVRELVDKQIVRAVIVDPTTVPVSLEVSVNEGTYDGLDSVSYVQARVPQVYQGVPVRVTAEKLDTGNPGFGYFSKP